MVQLLLEPLSEEWKEHRRTRISATDVPKILGFAPPSWGSALSVWARITGKFYEAPTPTPEMEWGSRSEPLNRAWYEEQTGRKVSLDNGRYFVHDTISWLVATPDGIITGPTKEHGHAEGVWEAKAPSSYTRSAWESDVPDVYKIQTQAQMAVTGLDWAGVSALLQPRLVTVDVERDPRFQEIMLERLHDFWANYVMRDIMPPAVAADSHVLAALHRPAPGKRVFLPPSLAERAFALVEWERTSGEAEEQIKAVQAELKAFAVGEHAEEIVTPNLEYGWTYKERAGYTRPACEIKPTMVFTKMKAVKVRDE